MKRKVMYGLATILSLAVSNSLNTTPENQTTYIPTQKEKLTGNSKNPFYLFWNKLELVTNLDEDYAIC